MKKPLTETHPHLVYLWHPTKNGDLTPQTITAGSGQKVWWKCPVADDHEWQARVYNIVNGCGCSCCSGHVVVQSNCLLTTHPEIVKKFWHPTKNGDLQPNMVVHGSEKRVWWKCPVADDHEWMARITNVANGRECPCCLGRVVVLSNCLSTTHPDVVNKFWHPTKNDNTPEEITFGCMKKMWWKCPVADDHEWQEIPAYLSKGHGCPFCAGKRVCLSNCLATTNPEIAQEWHPKNKLLSHMVMAHSNKKVWWRCCKGHEWQAIPSNRTNGRNCPICNESKGEKLVGDFLEKNNFQFKRQHRFKTCRNKRRLPFDFVVYGKNWVKAIEYQGEQHYVPVSFGGNANLNFSVVNKHDAIKRNWCHKNQIPLLEIPYWNIDTINLILSDFLDC
jgi:hypothetical protein